MENIGLPTKTETKQETWEKSVHFLMTCIAMSVGFGNIWRFPFTAYENGGGAFLVPYIIVLFLVGRPVYFLEMCLGQFSKKSHIKVFESLCPILKGVAFGQICVCVCGSFYYCSLLAITMFYLFYSFNANLPWAECLPDWNTDGITCLSSKTKISNNSRTTFRSSSELWFVKEVLQEKTQIEDGIGLPEWRLTAFLFLSWAIIFALSANGIKSSGKFSYFLALFPYAIFLALLIRVITLKGSSKGILYFLSPQWDQLLNVKVWYNAITQCFFSLNIGSSAIVTLSSFNNFRHNIYRDALIVTTLDTFTSIISGITIFGVLGNLAYEMQVEVTEVISSGGTRLAFISYPDAIAKFDTVPWLFSILFFLMLYVVGIGSMIAGHTSLYSFLKAHVPYFKKWQASLAVACAGFLGGLPFLTPGGQFALTLVDYFGVTFLFFILTTTEVIAVIWWYGLEQFCNDIEFMLNRKLGFYWKFCWGIITPCVLITVMVYFLSTLQTLKNGVYDFPGFVLNIGWCLFSFGISQILLWWIVFLYKNMHLGIYKAILHSLSCKSWRPSNQDIFEKWRTQKDFKEEENLAKTTSWFEKKFLFFFGK